MINLTHFKRTVMFLGLLSVGFSMNAAKKVQNIALEKLLACMLEEAQGKTPRLRVISAKKYLNMIELHLNAIAGKLPEELHGKRTRGSVSTLAKFRKAYGQAYANLKATFDSFKNEFARAIAENKELREKTETIDAHLVVLGMDMNEVTEQATLSSELPKSVRKSTRKKSRLNSEAPQSSLEPRRLSFNGAGLGEAESDKKSEDLDKKPEANVAAIPLRGLEDFAALLGDVHVEGDGLDHKHPEPVESERKMELKQDLDQEIDFGLGIDFDGFFDEPVVPVSPVKVVEKSKKFKMPVIAPLNILKDWQIEAAVKLMYSAITKESYKFNVWIFAPSKKQLTAWLKELQQNPAKAWIRLPLCSAQEIQAQVEAFLVSIRDGLVQKK